jgi:hypothetical protein
MNLSPKLKKRILWVFLLPVLFLLLAGAIIYFFAVYRFKDSVKFIIDKESQGKFAFDASDATLSIWHRSILLKNSVLYCTDTANADVSIRVRIPEIYFSIMSWKDLLLRKKIIIDSLSIVEPFIDVDVRKSRPRQQSAEFHAADIVGYLQKALTWFNVHSFSLKDAAFRYTTLNSPAPLLGDHINLTVSNFTVVNNEDSHLLGSDNVSLLLGKQRWILPDGKHEINFNRMTFDSKGQRFELDSFSFYQKATTGKGAIRLRADKFFFNSRHLPAIYQKEQLLLDTVTCINPILSIPGYGREDSTVKPRFNSNFFNRINIGFVDVADGELRLQNKDDLTSDAVTQKANLRIFNLTIHPTGDSAITTDSIRIDLKKIAFLTKDSLYQLTIGEFAFRRNDALFRNVRFEPVRPGSHDKGVEFTAPSLLLKDISLVDLLRRRLKASGAELRQPLIILYDKNTASGGPGNTFASGSPGTASGGHTAPGTSAEKLALFYRTLHHVSELINTRDFYVIDGAVRYQLTGTIPLNAAIEDLNAHLLLNKFFISDSLVDIKHAIPDWRIGRLNLSSKGINISITHYGFDGVRGLSRGQQVGLKTAAGMEFTGDNIYWDVFDWDAFQKNRNIRIDSLHADRLTIHLPHSSAQPDPSVQRGSPPLPIIRIGKLAVNDILFDGGAFHFTINNLQAAGIGTTDRFFTWARLRMNVRDIALEGRNSSTSIHAIDFDNDKEMIVKDLEFQSHNAEEKTRISVPLIRLSTGLHSSDLSQLTIASLLADTITAAYTRSGKDTLELSAGGRISGRRLQFFPGGTNLLQYAALDLDLNNIRGKKGRLRLEIPESSLHLSDGHLASNSGRPPSLLSSVRFEWKDAALGYNRDSTALSVTGMAGSFGTDAFEWSPAVKIGWPQLAAAATISKGSFHYQGKNSTAGAAAFAWDPHRQRLDIRDFSVIPKAGRDETFSRAQWQGDYIVLKGEALSLSGIRFDPPSGDSSIGVRQVVLDGITLTASRDKQIPFRHGFEKLMPTKLINSIPLAVRIDSLWVRRSNITYDERSAATHKWSSVKIEDIDGRILRLGNRNNLRDTLSLAASGKIFDGHIRHFYYKESYGDSLSSFSARASLSQIDLTRLSQVSIPAANVSVTDGHADTLYSSWQGNKYASYGTMNFYYDKLKIRVLNKKDSTRRGFLPTLETWAANLILPNKRQHTSTIFFERNREKFVFNYWIKSQTSGILTTVGLKSDRTYRREYEKLSKQFSLPAQPPQ